MYLRNLHIKNFRCIEDLDIEFNQGLNVIIGANNCGKTAILDTLRLALASGNYQRDARILIDDFYIDEFGRRRDGIEIDLTFSDVSDEEKGIFVEMLALKNHSLVLELHIRHKIEMRNGIEKIRAKYWGGDKEGNTIPIEILELFYCVHLEALRDAEEKLVSNRGNRLGQLLTRLLPKKGDQDNYSQKLNASIKLRAATPP